MNNPPNQQQQQQAPQFRPINQFPSAPSFQPAQPGQFPPQGQPQGQFKPLSPTTPLSLNSPQPQTQRFQPINIPQPVQQLQQQPPTQFHPTSQSTPQASFQQFQPLNPTFGQTSTQIQQPQTPLTASVPQQFKPQTSFTPISTPSSHVQTPLSPQSQGTAQFQPVKPFQPMNPTSPMGNFQQTPLQASSTASTPGTQFTPMNTQFKPVHNTTFTPNPTMGANPSPVFSRPGTFQPLQQLQPHQTPQNLTTSVRNMNIQPNYPPSTNTLLEEYREPQRPTLVPPTQSTPFSLPTPNGSISAQNNVVSGSSGANFNPNNNNFAILPPGTNQPTLLPLSGAQPPQQVPMNQLLPNDFAPNVMQKMGWTQGNGLGPGPQQQSNQVFSSIAQLPPPQGQLGQPLGQLPPSGFPMPQPMNQIGQNAPQNVNNMMMPPPGQFNQMPPTQQQQSQQQQQPYQQQQSQQQPQQPQQQPPQQDQPNAIINPNQMPRVQDKFETTTYQPACGVAPPLANSDYFVSLNNNSFVSPRFLRFTHNAIAKEYSIQSLPGIQLGGIVQPLAEPQLGEEAVSVHDVSCAAALGLTKTSLDSQNSLQNDKTTVASGGGIMSWLGLGDKKNASLENANTAPTSSLFNEMLSPTTGQQPSVSNPFSQRGQQNQGLQPENEKEFTLDVEFEQSVSNLLGPLRCARCRAYANPYFTFNPSNNGTTFTCNFCFTEQQCPEHWYSNLDGNQQRLDRSYRNEFSKGSIEYIVPPFYSRTLILPPSDSNAIGNVPELDAIRANIAEIHERQSIQRIGVRSGMNNTTNTSAAKNQKETQEKKKETILSYTRTFVPHFVFVIDVTPQSLQGGVLDSIVESLGKTLKELSSQVPRAKVAIVCYNHVVFIPRFIKTRNEYTFVAMCDIQQPFLPIPAANSFVSLDDAEALNILNNVILELPTIFTESHQDALQPSQTFFQNENCFGSALQIAYYLLEQKGGKVLSFLSSTPNIGLGSTPPALLQAINQNTTQNQPTNKNVPSNNSIFSYYFTDKEELLYQNNEYYRMLGVYSAYNSITYDLYVCSIKDYCNIAMFNDLCRLSSGQIYYYRAFTKYNDSIALSNDIKFNLLRNTGFNAIMTVRCSAGVEIGEYYGNCFIPQKNEILLSSIDSHKSIGFTLNYTGKQLLTQELSDKSKKLVSQLGQQQPQQQQQQQRPFYPENKVYVQIALLFQSILGDTRIRVHTHPIDIVTDLAAIYRQLDPDVIVNLLLKKHLSYNFSPLRCYYYQESLNLIALETLYAYRKVCARNTSSGQLILPEKLKLLPLYILGVCKHALLREGLHADERHFYLSYLRQLPVHISSTLFIPKIYELTSNIDLYHIQDNSATQTIFADVDPALDQFGEIVSRPQPQQSQQQQQQQQQQQNLLGVQYNTQIETVQIRNRVYLPQSLSLSATSLAQDKIYLLDDTICVYIWVGPFVPPALRALLFKTITHQVSTNTLPVKSSTNSNTQSQQQQQQQMRTEQISMLLPRPVEPFKVQAPHELPQATPFSDQQQPPQPSQPPQFNPFQFYAHRLLSKLHNIIDHLHADKSLHQKVHIIHATSLPRSQFNDQNNQTTIRTMDEIVFAKKMIEDTSQLHGTRGYTSDSKSFSCTLPSGTTVAIPPSNTVVASQRAAVMSYVDYLVWAHKSINSKLAKDG